MTLEQVQEALRGRLGSEVVEHTGVCESVLRTLLRYAPYRDTLDDLEKRVESCLFDELYGYLGDSMTVLLDDGSLPSLADDVMGVLFRNMQVYSVTYEKLKDYALYSGSLSAMRTLCERFDAFQSAEEKQLMEKIIQDRAGEA